MGNLGPAGYERLCRDHDGRIMTVFLGAIGVDTNNLVELEGMIRGFEVLIRGGCFPMIIEGDLSILI